MIRRYDFVDRVIYLLREKMENELPEEDLLENYIDKLKIIFRELFK